MSRTTKTLLTVIALACAASASAQEFYVGSLYEQGEGTFADSGENLSFSGPIGLAGVRLPVNSRFFVGGEAEMRLDTGLATGTATSDTLNRYRAVVGATLPNVTFFVGAGAGDLSHSLAANSTGATLNVGVDVLINDIMTVRIEAIQDRFDNGSLSTVFDNEVLRIGTLINF